MADSNKVKFGLKNVHYAKVTFEDVDGYSVPTFDTPKRIPGAVNLSMEAQGDENTFYADDTAYYTTVANNGYSGDLEVAKIPDSFRIDILNEVQAENGMIIEDADAGVNPFALLFEFKGDANRTRHVLYYCNATRPSVEGSTTEQSAEPQTETITISALPLPIDSNGKMVVKAKCNEGDGAYENWYTAVQKYTLAG